MKNHCIQIFKKKLFHEAQVLPPIDIFLYCVGVMQAVGTSSCCKNKGLRLYKTLRVLSLVFSRCFNRFLSRLKNSNINNETLNKREPLVNTRARRAVKKKEKKG